MEVKTPENKKGATKYQKRQLELIVSAGGQATVITSVKEALKMISA